MGWRWFTRDRIEGDRRLIGIVFTDSVKKRCPVPGVVRVLPLTYQKPFEIRYVHDNEYTMFTCCAYQVVHILPYSDIILLPVVIVSIPEVSRSDQVLPGLNFQCQGVINVMSKHR